jgi:hypothetical protein
MIEEMSGCHSEAYTFFIELFHHHFDFEHGYCP